MFSLAVVGDTTFARPLEGDPVEFVQAFSPELRGLLEADILLANLESVLVENVSGQGRGSGASPLCSPLELAAALKELGVDVVSLANNHILDHGEAAMLSTMAALDEAGIAYFGAGRNLAEASEPVVLERNGHDVAFLGFGTSRYPTRGRSGSLPFLDRQGERLIRSVRDRHDFVVVYFHQGIEALSYPMASTVRAARQAVNAGASLVLGTHPHTVQGIQWHRDVPIAYSLGNFIMAMLSPGFYEKWRAQTGLTTMGIPFEKSLLERALVLRCQFHADAPVEAKAVPITLGPDGVPRVPTGEAAAEARSFFNRLCEEFNHPDDPVWRRRDEIEKGFQGLQRKQFTWRHIFKNIHKLRLRHLATSLKLLRGPSQ